MLLFLKRRLWQPVTNLLTLGMTPHKLASTVALGAVVGVVPALGVTTIIGTALAARFRLNIAATILVSYLVHPLQILLALPFIKAGIYVFGLAELQFSFDEIIAMFKADWLHALSKLWMANLAGVAAWAVVALPAGAMLYLLLLPVLRRLLPQTANSAAVVQ